GNGKNVTASVALTGSTAGNYQLTSGSASTTASINKRHVTASITAADKTYDGTTAASITSCTLEPASGMHGVVSPDDAGCSASNGQFASASAGTSKNVTASVGLTGSTAGNYQLTSGSASTTASINKR